MHSPQLQRRAFTESSVNKRRQEAPLHAPRHTKEPHEKLKAKEAQSKHTKHTLRREMADKKADHQKRIAAQKERSLSTVKALDTTVKGRAQVKPLPAPLQPVAQSVAFSFANLIASTGSFASPVEVSASPQGQGQQGQGQTRTKNLAEERNKRKREKLECSADSEAPPPAPEEPAQKRQTLQEKRNLWKQHRAQAAAQSEEDKTAVPGEDLPDETAEAEEREVPGVNLSVSLPEDIDEMDDVIKSRLNDCRREGAPQMWTETQVCLSGDGGRVGGQR